MHAVVLEPSAAWDTRAEGNTMEKTLVEVCAMVVTAQAQCQSMTSEEISESLRTLYGTLETLNRAAYAQPPSTGDTTDAPHSLVALRHDPKRSIQKERVVCLECGNRLILLSNRHLALHRLTPREYKHKWGLALGTALSARTLTARRRKLAKQMGMGEGLVAWREGRKHAAG